MILKLLSIIIITALPTSSSTTTSAVSSYNQTSSALQTLYSQSSPLTTDSTTSYSVIYPTSKTTAPQIIIGLLAFRDVSDMSAHYLKIAVITITDTRFTVQVSVENSATINLVRISYLATNDMKDNIYPIFKQYNSGDLTNINSGSGLRSQSISQTFFTLTGGDSLNTNLSKNYATPLIIGFEASTQLTFQLSASIVITNSISFNVLINTKQDCQISMVYFCFLFIDLQLWQGLNIITSLSSYSAIVDSTDSASFSYNYLNTQNFMFGLTEIQIEINNVTVQTFYNFQLITADSTSFLFSHSSNIVNLQMHFFFIAQIGCTEDFPYFTNTLYQQCTDACQSGQTTQPANTICTTCQQFCSTCTISLEFCTACQEGYQLTSSKKCSKIDEPIATQQFPLWIIGVIVGVLIIICLGLYCFFRRPTRTLFEDDIRMHPSIDIL